MLKNLFILQPSSQVILDMCVNVLDYKLQRKPDHMLIQFWLYTARAVASDNPSVSTLKDLFKKYSSLLDSKKDSVAIDFLKIVQEYVLLNFFSV